MSSLQGLDLISTSKLSWPQIHPPAQTSWQLWTTMICNIFVGSPTRTKICQPLGDWTDIYQEICSWHWCLLPPGSLLHQTPLTSNPHAAILTQSQQTKLTFSSTIPTNQTSEGPLVTPFDSAHHAVHLPVPPLQQVQQPIKLPLPYGSLIAQFCMTLATWQQSLFGPIQWLQPTNCTLQVSQARGLSLWLVMCQSKNWSTVALPG